MAFHLRARATAGCFSLLLGGLLSAPIAADVPLLSFASSKHASPLPEGEVGSPTGPREAQPDDKLRDPGEGLQRIGSHPPSHPNPLPAGEREFALTRGTSIQNAHVRGPFGQRAATQAPLVVALADSNPAALTPGAAKADVAITEYTQRDLPTKAIAQTPDGLMLRSARKGASRSMWPPHPSRRRGACHRAALCADPLAPPQDEGGPTHAVTRSDRAATSAVAATPAPARFFTINQVLAKQKTRAKDGSTVQLAALDPAPIANDSTPVAAPARGDEPFGLFTFRAPDGLLWAKWRKVEAQMRAEAPVLAKCRADQARCTPAAARFNAIVDAAKAERGRAQLALVNERINEAIHYTSDYVQFGVADRWSAPLASLASGLGDCEDYAIAKYAALRAAGLPDRDLHVLLVRDNAVHLDHAVLAVREGAHWLILDNRWSRVTVDAELHRFAPLFALDEQGVKLFAAPYAERLQKSQAISASAAPAGDVEADNSAAAP